MVRLRAKIEIEPNSLAIRRIRKVPTIARPPIISGSSEATRLRKKSSESRKSSGKASISAICRSFSTCLLTCSWATAEPPTTTPGWAESRSAMSSPVSCQLLSSVGLQGDGEVGGAAVVGDEGGGVGVVVAGHRLDVGACRAPALSSASTRARRRRRRRPARSRPRRAPPAMLQPGVLQPFARLHRLGGGVVGPIGVEAAGDRAAEGAGERRRRRSRGGRTGGRGRRRGGRGRRTSAAPFLGERTSRIWCLHPLAPVGEPIVELDSAPQHHQRERVLLWLCRLGLHRAQPLDARRARWSRIARRISAASWAGRAPAKKSFSSPSSRIS